MRKRKRTASQRTRGRNGTRMVVFITIIAMVVGAYLIVKYRDRLFPPVVPKRVTRVDVKPITLYFSDEKGLMLKAEKGEITRGELVREIKDTLEALIQGPKGNLTITIPGGTRLLKVELKDGVAYVDFSKALSKNHPGGSSAELQTIYSIVNTVTLNFPEIKKVQILIEGKKARTLAGHIDITFPIGPDKGLIKG